MISIIVPVYNSEDTIVTCVESIKAQDYSDWELLLIDDGSVDQSLSLCEEFSKQDSRIHVISQKHKGVSAARNNGLDKIQGQYVCFVDSDDVVDSNHLSSMHSKREFEMVICGYSVDEYDSSGYMIKQSEHIPIEVHTRKLGKERRLLKSLFASGMIHINCNKLLHTDIIANNGIRYKEIPVNEDYMFMLEYLMNAESLCAIQTSTYHWNRVVNKETGVSSLPDNLLQVYTEAHILTRAFFKENMVADSIMYYTYYLLVLKYVSAVGKGALSKDTAWNKLHELMNDELVLASFQTRKNVALGEYVMNTLLKHHCFGVFYTITKFLSR